MRAHQTKTEFVVNSIREYVLSGQLKPGERILQNEIADRLDVSPTPVREALRQLEAEGILSHSPHHGVRVREVDPNGVQEIYMIRAVIEAFATSQAAPNLDESKVTRLHGIQETIEECVKLDELHRLRKLNYDFHMLIYSGAAMPELMRIIYRLWTRFPWDTLHVLPNRARVSAAEHREVIEALESGNDVEAALAMKAHIESGANALLSFLSESQDESDGHPDTQ